MKADLARSVHNLMPDGCICFQSADHPGDSHHIQSTEARFIGTNPDAISSNGAHHPIAIMLHLGAKTGTYSR